MMEVFEILTGGTGRVKDEFEAIRRDVDTRHNYKNTKDTIEFKSCTIRLPVKTVYLIDAFAHECQMSRNDLVSILVNDSISDALYGFFRGESEAASFTMAVDRAYESGLSWDEWKDRQDILKEAKQ